MGTIEEDEMAEVKCVEPSMVDKVPGSNYVCMVKPEDTLVFPHVDVCMAAAWINTTNWAMIGGHVPGKWDQDGVDDLNGCAQRVFSLMDKRWGERSVDLIITIGDPSGVGAPAWTDIVKTMVRNLDAQRYLMIWKDTPGGADLTIDGPARKLTVASARTRHLILERTFDSIQREERPIRYDAPVLFKMVENLKSHFKPEPFKGASQFHESCKAEEQERITNFFKDIFQRHGPCTEFQAPSSRGLSGEASFKFKDGELVKVELTLAQHGKYKDRYLIANLTSNIRRFGHPV
jgi:hypothetical protein